MFFVWYEDWLNSLSPWLNSIKNLLVSVFFFKLFSIIFITFEERINIYFRELIVIPIPFIEQKVKKSIRTRLQRGLNFLFSIICSCNSLSPQQIKSTTILQIVCTNCPCVQSYVRQTGSMHASKWHIKHAGPRAMAAAWYIPYVYRCMVSRVAPFVCFHFPSFLPNGTSSYI